MRTRVIEFVRELVGEIRRVRDVIGVTSNLADALRIVSAWFILTLKFRFHVFHDLEITVKWTCGGRAFSAHVGDVSELRVLREVFVLDEYALPPGYVPSSIIDLGSNAGFSVLSFAARFPSSSILAVEPDPRTYRRLVRNTRHLANVVTVQSAVTAEDGEVDIYVGNESWSTGVVPGAGRTRSITVRSQSLERLIDRAGLEDVGLLKMDIEGAELEVLASPALREVDLVVFEFHQEYSSRPLSDLVAEVEGFEMVRCRGDTSTHPLVTLSRADRRLRS